MTQPQMEIRLAGGSPFFGSSRTAPVTFDVSIANTSPIPFSVRRIELSTPSSVEFGIYPAERLFNEAVAPGEQKTMSVTATAYNAGNARMSPTEPLAMRMIVEFEHEGKRWREVTLSRGLD